MGYRIVDAKDGLIEAGRLSVDTLRNMQPWGEPIAMGNDTPTPKTATAPHG